LKDIYARLAEKSEVATFGVGSNQSSDLIHGDSAGIRDSLGLRLG
jgi:hypothetical protein